MRIMKLLKRQLGRFKDVIWNFGAFAVYIGTQQLLIMPILAKRFTEDIYSQAAVFLTIYNIVVCVTGDELGNTYLVRKNEYERAQMRGDFFPICSFVSAALVAMGILLNIFFFKYSAIVLASYVVIFVCGIIKYFLLGYLKGSLRFSMIFYANAVYAVGAMIGVALLSEESVFIVPFLCGEIPAALFALIAVRRFCRKEAAWQCSPQLCQTTKDYARLSISTLLTECTTHLDRLLVYPQLGAAAMSIYYSSTTMSKLTSMVTNPISGVILARLSNKNREDHQAVVNSTLISWPTLVGTILAFNLVLAPLALKILYNQFFKSAIQLLIPVSIAGALSGANFLIKPAILKFHSTSVFLIINLIYALFFIICLYIFSERWGMMGYAIATVVSRMMQSVCYLLVLLHGNKLCKDTQYGN